MAKKRKNKKKKSINEIAPRCMVLSQGPIKEKTCGPPKGKKQYSRKNKNWKKEF
jgi:hypothetical protein